MHMEMTAVNHSPLRLYVDAQFTSPYALSAFVVLREKGIDFEIKTPAKTRPWITPTCH
jgi:hypothetical protein